MTPVRWEFFFGACFLTGALLLPHAAPLPLFGGMACAGLIRVAWSELRRIRSPKPPDEPPLV